MTKDEAVEILVKHVDRHTHGNRRVFFNEGFAEKLLELKEALGGGSIFTCERYCSYTIPWHIAIDMTEILKRPPYSHTGRHTWAEGIQEQYDKYLNRRYIPQ